MISHILIVLAALFMFEIFQSLRDLDMAQATLVHYINISEPLPETPTDTLTSSIRQRVNELYGHPGGLIDATIVDTTADMSPLMLQFYKDYMKLYMNKMSSIQLFTDQDSNLKLFTLNSRWIKAKAYTDFSMHTLKEEKLYQVNPKELQGSHRRVWKHCFYQRLNNSAVEATAGNKEQDVIAVALYNAQNNSRSFMYFDRLKYNYSNSMSTSDFSEQYYKGERRSGGIDSNVDYKSYQDLSSPGENNETVNNLPELDIYDIIPIDEDYKIEHMAVAEDLIVYTTVEERMKLKYMFKTNNQTWTTKTLEYPIASVRFRIHKNIGMSFIYNAPTGDKQLLLLDLIANEAEVQIIFHLFQFVQGDSLMEDEMLRYSYGVPNKEKVESGKIYGTKSSAGKISLPQELATIDILKSFPRSIIKSNPVTKQVLIASLNKYVFVASKENQKEAFNFVQIRHFEDMNSRIKDAAISEDGTYFSFLTYNKDSEKVWIIQSKAMHSALENKLYLVAFNYAIGSQDNTIKETRIINSQNNEPVLLLLMEAGEVATFSLEFGVMTWHGLSGVLSGDDLDFVSLFSVLLVIVMFIIAKVASSTRIRINLQRLR